MPVNKFSSHLLQHYILANRALLTNQNTKSCIFRQPKIDPFIVPKSPKTKNKRSFFSKESLDYIMKPLIK